MTRPSKKDRDWDSPVPEMRVSLGGGVSGIRGSGRAASHRVGQYGVPSGTWRGYAATAWKRCEANGLAGTASEINAQWRICFRWSEDGPYEVEIVDYH